VRGLSANRIQIIISKSGFRTLYKEGTVSILFQHLYGMWLTELKEVCVGKDEKAKVVLGGLRVSPGYWIQALLGGKRQG
jgi:hypothetical protein